MTDSGIPPVIDSAPPSRQESEARFASWCEKLDAEGDFWIFAYGFLLWDRDFPIVECREATVGGWRRALCLYSVRYRGTPERPGLVLGLEEGGYCEGRVYRISEGDRAEAARKLWAREMVMGAYRPLCVTANSAAGPVRAQTFVIRHDHPQYAPPHDEAETLAIVRTASGERGANVDYILQTVDHLREAGIEDPELFRLAHRIESAGTGGEG